MGDAAGHYFEPEPTAASRPCTIRLDLPDRSLDLRTDRGVFSAGRVDPATKYLLLEAPPPPDEGTFVDLGCGYGAIACTLAARRPAAEVWAVDVNRRAVALCHANATALGLTNVAALATDEVPHEATGRPDLVQPADPRRQARAPRAPPRLVGPPVARRVGRAGGPQAPRGRLARSAGSRPRGGGRVGWARGTATGCWSWRGEAARRHRHEAPPPRVAQAHRGPARAGARRRAGPLQRRRDHPHGGCPAGRGRLAHRPHTRARRRQGGQDRARHGPLPHVPPGRRTAPPPRTPPAPPATRWSAIELTDQASALHDLRLGPATCLVVGHEDRGCPPATLAACDAVAFLPLLGRVGSLNVATAASIAMYEVRRRWTSWGILPEDRADAIPPPRYASARRGSTSTRRRPGGRGTAARASQRTWWSAARRSQRPSATSATWTPDGRPSASMKAGGRRPGDLGQGARTAGSPGAPGVPARRRPPARGRPGPRPARPRGPGRRVCRSTRPAGPGAGRPGAGGHPRRPGHQREGLLRGAVARGQAAPGRDRGRPPRRPGRCAAAPPRCRPPPASAGSPAADAAVTSTTGSPTTGLELLADAGHAGPHVPEAHPAAGQAHRRPLGAAASAAERLVGLVDGRAAGLAGRQLTARRAGEQTGPARAVEHAQDAGVGPQQAHQRVGVEAGPPRVLGSAVDHLHDRPPRPFGGAARDVDRGHGSGLEGGAR